MIPDLDKVNIYIRPGVTDMRKQVNGLSIIVTDQMDDNPGSGGLFLFCSRDRRLMKCIWWDRNGFCLWQKRLEKGKYPWPETSEKARTISREQLSMLLDGIDFWNAYQSLTFDEMN